MFRSIKLTAACATLTTLFVAAPASGQYYVQQGNVLDANNRVGSGGLNYGARQQPINTTNRLITGNVTGGAAFQGYSPIGNPNQLFLGNPATPGGFSTNSISVLPSDRLTTFRRDSYSVAEMRQMQMLPGYQRFAPQPYFSQTGTVINTGQILRGFNEPGTSQIRSSYLPLDTQLRGQPQNPLQTALQNNLVGQPLRVDSQLVRVNTGTTVTGPVNRRLLASPLFGNYRAVPLSDAAAEANERAVPLPVAPRTTEDRNLVEPRGTMRTERRGSAMDAFIEQRPIDRDATAPPQTDEGAPMGPTAASSLLNTGEGTLARPIGPRTDPTGQALAAGQPRGAAAVTTLPPRNAWRNQLNVEDGQLRTFVGTQEGRLKEQLVAAEAALREQRYYDAARHYGMAHAIDLTNPVPLTGRAIALLAAGDYVASANDLFMAIELAGPQGALKIDLKQFIPDLKVLDLRRAFLEQRLERSEDFRMRFLLGWAEYMSDLPQDGLANMRQAAEAAPESMEVLPRFVESLAARELMEPSAPATQPN